MNPVRELDKITPKEGIYSLADSSIYEIYDRAIEYFNSGVFVELGSFYGGSSYYLADKIRKSGKDIKLYCVDVWERIPREDTKIELSDGRFAEYVDFYKDIEGSIFNKFWDNVKEFSDIIRPLQCDSALAAGLFDKVDFVFLDADHSYVGVWNDLIAWKDKCKWLAGHDYNLHVWQAVNELFNESEIENVQEMSFLIKRA